MFNDLIKKIITQGASAVTGGEFSETVNTAAISMESLGDDAKIIAKSGRATMDETIKSTFEGFSLEAMGDDFTPLSDVAIKAATDAAALAISPEKSVRRKLKAPAVDTGDVAVSLEMMGAEDVENKSTLALEAFDGADVENAVAFSMAVNALTATQEGMAELFFPTIMMDPSKSGINIKTTIELLQDTFIRDGVNDSDKFNYKTMVQAYLDTNILKADRNKLVPAFNNDRADMMYGDITYVDDSNGENITTAPLRIGKKIELVGISQSAVQLTKGSRNYTDTLDRRVSIEHLYFEMKNAAGDVTEVFKQDISILPYRGFTWSIQGNTKDLSLSFDTEHISFKIGKTKDVNGADTTIATLAAGYTVKLAVGLMGKGNVTGGDITVNAVDTMVASVKDVDGNIVAKTDAKYIAIVEAFSRMKLVAYTVEAYVTNSNMRHSGQTATVTSFGQVYTVPYRTGVMVQKPETNEHDTDNDANHLGTVIKLINLKTEHHAIRSIFDFAAQLKAYSDNDVDISMSEIGGVGRRHVKPYTFNDTIDAVDLVDSIRSSERKEDIAAALQAKIKKIVEDAYIASEYKVAIKLANNGIDKAVHVIIGTDPITASYIAPGGKMDLGDKIIAHIETSDLPEVKGKIVMSFGVFGSDRNTKPNPYNFGQCIKSAEVTTDVQREVDGALVRMITTNPRYLHIINLPIIMVLNIINIDVVLGKVTANRHNI